MNIIFKTKICKDFEDVKVSQVFIYEGDIYMKIYGRDGSIDEAVDLSDGNVYHFDDDEEVNVVDATLNVDYFEN